MKSRRFAIWTTSAICLAMTVSQAIVALGATSRRATSGELPEWMRQITDHLVEIKPLLDQLDLMKDVIMSVKATSPTLEKLDKLRLRADLVEKLDADLERIEKVEPVLRSLEAMQRDFARRHRTRAGNLPRKVPKWTEIFDQMQGRLDRIEKSLYAPSVLRDPFAPKKPIELRLDELEKRQERLMKELESVNEDIHRLRRRYRDRGL